MSEQNTVLELRGVYKRFGENQSTGLQDINLQVHAGETLALVGRSGSGKTTLARLIMRLSDPDSGQILLNSTDLGALRGAKLRSQRSKFQMVFQDPLAAFNPRSTVGQILSVPLQLHGRATNGSVQVQIAGILERVGLTAEMATRFPRELSGGQRQRVAIARAVLCRPQLIVLDEPVSALDVSVRAKILNLLLDLQRESGTAYLFIAHDLALVRAVADQMLVMDKGQIVERGSPDTVLRNPQAQATRVLVDAVPQLKF